MSVQHQRSTGLRILLTVLKVLYIILFAVSAFVLVLFLVFKLVVKPTAHVYNVRKNGKQVQDMARFHHDAFYRANDVEVQAGVFLAPGQMEVFCIEE